MSFSASVAECLDFEDRIPLTSGQDSLEALHESRLFDKYGKGITCNWSSPRCAPRLLVAHARTKEHILVCSTEAGMVECQQLRGVSVCGGGGGRGGFVPE